MRNTAKSRYLYWPHLEKLLQGGQKKSFDAFGESATIQLPLKNLDECPSPHRTNSLLGFATEIRTWVPTSLAVELPLPVMNDGTQMSKTVM